MTVTGADWNSLGVDLLTQFVGMLGYLVAIIGAVWGVKIAIDVFQRFRRIRY